MSKDSLYNLITILVFVGLIIGIIHIYGCGAVYRQGTCKDAWNHIRELECKSLVSEGPDRIKDTADDRTWLQLCEARQADPALRLPSECVAKAGTCKEAETCE